MRNIMTLASASFLAGFLGMALLTGCGGDKTTDGGNEGGQADGTTGGTVTVYAARKGNVIEPIVERFEAATGIKVVVVADKSGANLLSKMEAEAEAGKSAADVFWATDPAALGAAAAGGHLAALPADTLGRAPKAWQAKDGTWVGTSGRTRVLAYNPDLVKKADLPKTLEDLLDPKWKGKIGWAPSNGSFQAFLTAMRGVTNDDAKVKAWLEGMMANEAKIYPKNTPIVKALASGEIALGLTNHYYVTRAQVKDAKIPVEVARFEDGNIGNLVMVAGAGVVKSAKNVEQAKRFVKFLVEEEAQKYFAHDYCEYPVASDVATNNRLIPIDQLLEKSPKVDLSAMRDHAATIELLKTVGLQ